jgi:hypothetical protein
MGITFESLHESLLKEGPHRVYQDGHEESQPTSQELQEESNNQFETTIKFLEDRRERHVQSSVDVLCQTDSRPDSSGRVFQDSKTVRETMDIFDQITQKGSHVTQDCQTGSRIRYVCQSVCPGLKKCKENKGTCVFDHFHNGGVTQRKMWSSK